MLKRRFALRNAILLILCFVSFSAFTQNTYHIELDWENDKTFFTGTDDAPISYRAFWFEGAHLNHPISWLPIYTYRTEIPANSGDIKNVTLGDLVISTLNSADFRQYKGLDEITENFEVTGEIHTERNRSFLHISLIPIRRKSAMQIEMIESAVLKVEFAPVVRKNSATQKLIHKSVLSSGNWHKIGIKESGIQKITYEQLRQLGFSTPENCRFFGTANGALSTNNAQSAPDDLTEIPIMRTSDGLLFFAQSANSWKYNSTLQEYEHKVHPYASFSYIFVSDIATSFNNTLSIVNNNQSSGYPTTLQSDFMLFHEKDEINLIASGSTWYGEKIAAGNLQNFSFEEQKPIPGSDLKIRLRAAVRSFSGSSIQFSVGDFSKTISYTQIIDDYATDYARDGSSQLIAKSDGNSVSVGVRFVSSLPSAECYLDYISVQGKKLNEYTGKQFFIQNGTSTDSVRIKIIATQPIRVLDVTAFPFEHSLTIESDGYSFVSDGKSERQYLVFGQNDFHVPFTSGNGAGKVANQDLHAQPQAEFIIISHPDFLAQATQIGEWHLQQENLQYNIATPEQIYNEFSNGLPDAMALRNYIRMFYQRALAGQGVYPRYVLLFGDGTYNNKTAIAENWPVVPTFQSSNSVSPTQSFVSDDFYGMLDAVESGVNGALDVGIGRLPAKTKSEASILVQKIMNYYSEQSNGNWQNFLTFIADDEDGNLHMQDADILANKVTSKFPHFNVDKIYLDMYRQSTTSSGERYPDAVLAINNRVQRGSLLINYTGHGNEYRLAAEKIIDEVSIKSWKNAFKLPVFITATCEFSRFDKHSLVSAGEQILLSKDGGGIALFSTTRLVYSSSNMSLNTSFYNYVFENDINTSTPNRLGDIVRLAKNATGSASDINKRNFALLGDPALPLRWPVPGVSITAINTTLVAEKTDTLSALEFVEIEGQISANFKNSESMNGILIPTLYDKEIMRSTLANDGGNTMNFKLRNNILFQGNSSVTDGKFKFSFVMPRDVLYDFGKGKFSMYFKSSTDATHTAYGMFDNFVVGGISNSTIDDSNGPEIKIWLNDKNFVPSGTTNQTPVLLVEMNDTSGINTSRSAFGHEITLTLDNDTRNSIVLNDYFETETDNFRLGKIRYQIPELAPGKHTLKVKAWDVNNNSAEKYLSFEVQENSRLTISHVLNYPNPFTTFTQFYFEHNKPGQPLEVMVQIFSQSGQIVKTIHANMSTTGFRSSPIPWDGRDDFGSKLGRGVYFYKIFVKTNNEHSEEIIEKLVIL